MDGLAPGLTGGTQQVVLREHQHALPTRRVERPEEEGRGLVGIGAVVLDDALRIVSHLRDDRLVLPVPQLEDALQEVLGIRMGQDRATRVVGEAVAGLPHAQRVDDLHEVVQGDRIVDHSDRLPIRVAQRSAVVDQHRLGGFRVVRRGPRRLTALDDLRVPLRGLQVGRRVVVGVLDELEVVQVLVEEWRIAVSSLEAPGFEGHRHAEHERKLQARVADAGQQALFVPDAENLACEGTGPLGDRGQLGVERVGDPNASLPAELGTRLGALASMLRVVCNQTQGQSQGAGRQKDERAPRALQEGHLPRVVSA